MSPGLRPRAQPRVVDDEGLEELSIGGRRSTRSRRGFPSTLGAMGDPDLRALQLSPARTYLGEAPFGSMDPGERLQLLDAEGIDAVVLYTTIGLLWECEVEDPELAQAYTRAYNRWICDFCSSSPRLVPTAHLSLDDPVAAAQELARAVAAGARGAYVAPFTHDRRPLGHPDNPPPDPTLPPCAAAPRRHCHLGWPEYIDDLAELASAFPESDRRAFLGGNCRELFGIPATATATVRTTT